MATSFGDTRISSYLVLRFFQRSRLPADVVAHVFGFVDPAVILMLQALACAKRESASKRPSLSSTRDAGLRRPRTISPPWVPNHRFLLGDVQDHIDKVTAACARFNMRAGLRFIRERWPGQVRDAVIAAAAAREGNLQLLGGHLAGVTGEELGEIVRQAARGGALEAVAPVIDNVRASVRLDAEVIGTAFNFPNSASGRRWIIRLFAEHGIQVSITSYVRVKSIDLSVSDINGIVEGLGVVEANNALQCIYTLALQTNNRDLALNARIRASDQFVDTPAFGGCSLELWRELREIDRCVCREQTKEELAAGDAIALLSRACERNEPFPADLVSACRNNLSDAIGHSILFGDGTAALELLTLDHLADAVMFSVRRGDAAFLRRLCRKISPVRSEAPSAFVSSATEKWIAELAVAVTAGLAECVQVMARHYGKTDRMTPLVFCISDAQQVRNAMSGRRDRIQALRHVVEACGARGVVHAVFFWALSAVPIALHLLGRDALAKHAIECLDDGIDALLDPGTLSDDEVKRIRTGCAGILDFLGGPRDAWKQKLRRPEGLARV
ncbi:MAG: hypothetical protein KGL39_01105 [Patescibacteria group bacterium]|nr:hypothetical protein [Patescibacteria group bacterium]